MTQTDALVILDDCISVLSPALIPPKQHFNGAAGIKSLLNHRWQPPPASQSLFAEYQCSNTRQNVPRGKPIKQCKQNQKKKMNSDETFEHTWRLIGRSPAHSLSVRAADLRINLTKHLTKMPHLHSTRFKLWGESRAWIPCRRQVCCFYLSSIFPTFLKAFSCGGLRMSSHCPASLILGA